MTTISRHSARVCAFLFASITLSTAAQAQRVGPSPNAGGAVVLAVGENGSPELAAISRLRWRAIGPANQAGRIPMVVGVPGNRSVFYIGSAAGGLMKTTNGGITFTQLFDDQDNASIGDMVVSPSDPNILYLATGEGTPRNSASHSAQSVFFAILVLGVVLGLP